MIPLRRSAFTLVETLVCVVIVAVLALISVNSYSGALDQAELKFVTPALTRELEEFRRSRTGSGRTVTVTFELGTANYRVKGLKEDPAEEEARQLGGGILKRKLRFLRFESLEGTAADPVITFFPSGNHLGGTIYLGTGGAEHNIRVVPGGVVPSFVP